MAVLSNYVCDSCGYDVVASPHGHYGVMSGSIYQFNCKSCKEIVELSGDELSEMKSFPACPKCENDGQLYAWNPIDGRCPKCEGVVKGDGSIIMKD